MDEGARAGETVERVKRFLQSCSMEKKKGETVRKEGRFDSALWQRTLRAAASHDLATAH